MKEPGRRQPCPFGRHDTLGSDDCRAIERLRPTCDLARDTQARADGSYQLQGGARGRHCRPPCAPGDDRVGPLLPRNLDPVVLFPGRADMLDSLRARSSGIRPDLWRTLDDILASDPLDAAAQRAAIAHGSLYCASLTTWSARRLPNALLFAGHSVGELAALAAAGWLDELDGLRLVVRRAALMERAGADALRALAAEAQARGIPTALLPAGDTIAPPLMASAVEPFRQELARTRFIPRRTIVFSAARLAPFEWVAEELACTLTRPVRWHEALLSLRAAGTRTFVDVGPGRGLCGMVRCGVPDATAHPLWRWDD
jgi:[acyl-carrier-protein] S-malonyltransferase